MTLPIRWKPEPTNELVRLGPAEDGGYMLASGAVEASTLLLSMGLNADWRFEAAYLAAAPQGRVICFDGSVDRRFWLQWMARKLLLLRPREALHYFAYRRFFGSARAQHRRVMIGYDQPGSISLDTILAEVSDQSILLKVDIEGWEHRILDQIVAHRDRFTGVVIEVHDLDINRDRFDRFVRAMAGFSMVHLTPNNFAGMDDAGDPIVIEASLMRRDFVLPDARQETQATYHVLNDPKRPPIDLAYA